MKSKSHSNELKIKTNKNCLLIACLEYLVNSFFAWRKLYHHCEIYDDDSKDIRLS